MMNQEAAGRFLCHLRGRPQAEAPIMGGSAAPNIRGTVRFYQTPLGVLAASSIRGLPQETAPCLGRFFALHIHAGGACTGTPDFADAGEHYNPQGCEHPYHAGDLPPLLGSRGFAWSAVLTARFTVQEIIGKTVVIHAGLDDFTSQPAGNAGARIACGVIRAVDRDEPWPDPCGTSLLPPDEEEPEPGPIWEPQPEMPQRPQQGQRPPMTPDFPQRPPQGQRPPMTPDSPREESEPFFPDGNAERTPQTPQLFDSPQGPFAVDDGSMPQQEEIVPAPSLETPPFFSRMREQEQNAQGMLDEEELFLGMDEEANPQPGQEGVTEGDFPTGEAPMRPEDPPPLLSPTDGRESSPQEQVRMNPPRQTPQEDFSDRLFPRARRRDRDAMNQSGALPAASPSRQELAGGEVFLGDSSENRGR